jgi:cytochrome d ubiquinol oxidase subunit II
VTAADIAALLLWVGVIAYAIFGGADFGAGFWDLLSGGSRRGERPRELIEHSLGPVWEANHVWVVFCLVMLWTAFPPAFTAIMTALAVPLALAAFGVVLRGAGFAFRKASTDLPNRRFYGAAFAASSVITPFAMGTVAGAVASGRVHAGARSDHVTVWINPTSILGGVLAVTTCAYLAAVFLVADAQHREDRELTRYFTRRAFTIAGLTGVVALIGIFIVDHDAPALHHGLTHDGLPFVIASAVCGLGTLAVLGRRPGSLLSRALAIGAVAAVVTAWGVAQYPDMLPGELTIQRAASPSITLIWLTVIAVVAIAIVAPSFGLLYLLAQRGALEGEDLAAPVTGPAKA